MEHLLPEDYTSILIILGCVLLNALVSAFDTAIAVFGPMKAKQLADSKRGHQATHLRLWLDHPERVNTTIITFNTLIIALGAALATGIASRHDQPSPVIFATTIITVLVLVFGKVIPKSWAKARAEKIAPTALRVVQLAQFVIYPVVWIMSNIAERITKFFGGQPKQELSITEEDLEYLVTAGEKAGVLEETKKEIIVSVFDFGETKVREIMTPRTDITAISSDLTFEETVQIALDTGHSRLPVYEDRIDNVIGILLVKDLLRFAVAKKNGTGEQQIRKLLRQSFFVPESKLIMDVFKDLKRTKNHMAIVIDEYGGTAGVLTMEDILEELVGEIQDELDTEEAKIREIEPGIYDVLGSMNFDEFVDFFKLDRAQFEDGEEQDSDTLAGYLTLKLGELPELGQTVRIGPLNVEISRVERHRIFAVRVSRILAQGEEEATN